MRLLAGHTVNSIIKIIPDEQGSAILDPIPACVFSACCGALGTITANTVNRTGIGFREKVLDCHFPPPKEGSLT